MGLGHHHWHNILRRIAVAGLTALAFAGVHVHALEPGEAAPPRSLFAIIELTIQTLSLVLIPLAVAAAVLVFGWGLIKFIYKADSEDARTEGRQLMLWGIVALFVIVSIWGIIGFLGVALGVGYSGSCNPPQILEQGVQSCF